MLTKVEYCEKNGKAVLCRCYGTGSVLFVPEMIDCLPVAEIADHCFAREPSIRIRQGDLRTAFVSGDGNAFLSERTGERTGSQPNVRTKVQTGAGEEMPPLCGEELEEIYLPDTLEAIGDYAFYGCRNLKHLHLPFGLARLGGGAFVACNQIKTLAFSKGAGEETPHCMKDVAAELTYEIEVTVNDLEERPFMRLVFPEYYEESKENTPARIIESIYHGTGYQYRQCFQNRQMDFHQYDSLFPLAVAQEFYPTLFLLVRDRLTTPKGLSAEHRQMYLSWLKKEHTALSRRLFKEDDLDFLRTLNEDDFFTREILEEFSCAASEEGRAEAVSFLMDVKHEKFPAAKKRYVF